MPIRIASFNVENLFRRARVMNLATTAAARPILDDINALHDLLARTIYSDADKDAIKALLEKHNVEREELRPFFIQQVREKLYTLARVVVGAVIRTEVGMGVVVPSTMGGSVIEPWAGIVKPADSP